MLNLFKNERDDNRSSEKSMVAVFIDAENISGNFAGQIFEFAGSKGNIVMKKAFADWSNIRGDAWRNASINHKFEALQVFSIAYMKNAADAALTVSVMDTLFTRPEIDTFVIASGDSDYLSLVMTLKNRGKTVYGCGASTTIDAYRKCFNEFLELQKPLKAEEGEKSDKDELTLRDKNMLEKIYHVIERKPGYTVTVDSLNVVFKNCHFSCKGNGFDSVNDFLSRDDRFNLSKDGKSVCLTR